MDSPPELDLDDIKTRILNIKKSLTSKEYLPNAIKVIEAQKNHFEQLYSDQLSQTQQLLTEKLTLAKLKSKFESLSNDYNNLIEKYQRLELEKNDIESQMNRIRIDAEEKFEDRLLLIESEQQAQDYEYELKVQKLEENFKEQLKKTEEHYKSLLNQVNDKLKKSLSTNSTLQCEIMNNQTLANFHSGSQNQLQTEQVQKHKKEIDHYRQRLLYAEAKVRNLEIEVNKAKAKEMLTILNAQNNNDNDNNSVALCIPITSHANANLNKALQINAYEEIDQPYALDQYDKIPQLPYQIKRTSYSDYRLDDDEKLMKQPRFRRQKTLKKDKEKEQDNASEKITSTTSTTSTQDLKRIKVAVASTSTSALHLQSPGQRESQGTCKDVEKIVPPEKRKKRKLLNDSFMNNQLGNDNSED